MKEVTELERAKGLLEASTALSSPKLLIRAIFHIYTASTIVMQKRFKGEFAEMLLALQLQDPTSARDIREMHLLLAHHKDSPVEFVRSDVLVICSPDYEMDKLTRKKVEYYLDKAKIFIAKTTT